MAEFNISNSKVDQLNDAGDNIKVTGNQGAIAFTDQNGQTTQITGNENKSVVNKPESGIWGKLWKKISGLFGWGA